MDKLHTAADVSEATGVPEKTLAWWRLQGTGPAYVRIGRHVRYRDVDITRWLESQTVKRSPAA